MSLMFANNASATLATTLEIADTALIVNSAEGGMFPSPSDGNTFLLTIQDQSGQLEVVECTARSSDILTVTRAQEGTSAKEFAAGAVVEMRVTAGMLDTFLQPEDLDDYETTAAAEAKYLQESLNLSDLDSVATARTNLGLGTAAVEADTKYAHRANNLSDLASAATARDNLGLGDVATEDVVPIAKGGTGQTTLEDLQTALEIPEPAVLAYKASIRLNNAGSTVRADGCSVSKTSTGRWTVTFDDPYANLNRIMLSVTREGDTTAGNDGPQINYYNVTTSSVEVQVRNGGNDNNFDDAGWCLIAWELPAP